MQTVFITIWGGNIQPIDINGGDVRVIVREYDKGFCEEDQDEDDCLAYDQEGELCRQYCDGDEMSHADINAYAIERFGD